MKPSEKDPSIVVLEGRNDLENAKMVGNIYGRHELFYDLHDYAMPVINRATEPLRQDLGPYEDTVTVHAGAYYGSRKSDEARMVTDAENEAEVELTPGLSHDLLEALHNQAKLRGIKRLSDAARHPLATGAATSLRASYNAALEKRQNASSA